MIHLFSSISQIREHEFHMNYLNKVFKVKGIPHEGSSTA